MATGGGEGTAVTIHSDLLDCSICTYPLRPPVYQCQNGHVVCRSCWSKVQYKCPICKLPALCRNIALEKVLEDAHLPCCYVNLGCRKIVSYSQWQVHTDSCEFGPSLCPIPGCAHKAFSGEWLRHFLKRHRFPRNHFIYGQSCNVLCNGKNLYYTLLGPGEDLFLLVKEPIFNVGTAICLYYFDVTHQGQWRSHSSAGVSGGGKRIINAIRIRTQFLPTPDSSPGCATDQGKTVFPYELEVISRYNCITNSVHLKSHVVSFKQWKRGQVRASSLVVPLGFTESENMSVRVLIY